MKELWYLMIVVLMLGILGSLASITTPTSAFVANLPPQWDFPTTEFRITDTYLYLDLNDAFFDPDGDPVSFAVSPGVGVTAGVYGDVLVVFVEQNGEVIITASDGKNLVSQTIVVFR